MCEVGAISRSGHSTKATDWAKTKETPISVQTVEGWSSSVPSLPLTSSFQSFASSSIKVTKQISAINRCLLTWALHCPVDRTGMPRLNVRCAMDCNAICVCTYSFGPLLRPCFHTPVCALIENVCYPSSQIAMAASPEWTARPVYRARGLAGSAYGCLPPSQAAHNSRKENPCSLRALLPPCCTYCPICSCPIAGLIPLVSSIPLSRAFPLPRACFPRCLAFIGQTIPTRRRPLLLCNLLMPIPTHAQ